MKKKTTNLKMICPIAEVEEVFCTEHGGVFQCSRKNCLWLEFNQTTTLFKIRDLFIFKQHIDTINIEQMLEDPSRASDFKILMPFRSERCYILSVTDILNLRDILAGAKFMIKLNSEIKTCLNRRAHLIYA